jgi:hypothetical protein
MENTMEIIYILLHETIRKPKAIGTTSSARHSVAEKNEKLTGCITESGIFGEFSVSLVEGISEERVKRIETKAGTGKANEIGPTPTTNFDKDSFRWSGEVRIHDRSLDSTPGIRGDRKSIWNFLSSQSFMAVSSGIGMELSKAGEKSAGTGREGDRLLETEPVAIYKKKPKNLGRTWFSWTKADSSLLQTWYEHGRQEAQLRYCSALITERKFRPFLPLAYRRREGASLCTHGFIPTETSNPPKWLSFSATCSSTSVAMWYCFGTEVRRIKEALQRKLSVSTGVCIVTGFQVMRRNLIPTNSYGIRSSVLCPTVRRKIWAILNSFCMFHFKKYGNPRKDYGLAFMLPNYRGVNNYFHYLCVDQ